MLAVVGETLWGTIITQGLTRWLSEPVPEAIEATIAGLWRRFEDPSAGVELDGHDVLSAARERAGFTAIHTPGPGRFVGLAGAMQWFGVMRLWLATSTSARQNGEPDYCFGNLGVRLWLGKALEAMDLMRNRHDSSALVARNIERRFPIASGIPQHQGTVSGRTHDVANIVRARQIVRDIGDWVDRLQASGNLSRTFHRQPLDRSRPELGYGYVAQINHVSPHLPAGLPLYLILVDRNAPVPSGYGQMAGSPVILLRALDERGLANPYLGNWLTFGRSLALEHEIVHHLDRARGGGRLSLPAQAKAAVERVSRDQALDDESRGLVAYYNDPAELNAYFQEAVSSIVSILRNYGTGDPWHETLPQHRNPEHERKLRDTVWQAFAGSPQAFRQKVWEAVDRDFAAHLTAENRQRLEKRIYQLYQSLQQYRPVQAGTTSGYGYAKYQCKGCNAYLHQLQRCPDLRTAAFEEFVVSRNRSDRDAGELADISPYEIERLVREWDAR